MADNNNSADGCEPGCARTARARLFTMPNVSGGQGGGTQPQFTDGFALIRPVVGGNRNVRPYLANGAGVSSGPQDITIETNPELPIPDLGCGIPPVRARIGTIESTFHAGPVNPVWAETNGTARWLWVGNGGSTTNFKIVFDCPTDLVIVPGSFQGACESLFLITGPDEAYPYPFGSYTGGDGGQPAGVTAFDPREDVPNNTKFDDFNNGFSVLVWRQRSVVEFGWKTQQSPCQGQGAATSFFTMYSTLTTAGTIPQPCIGSAHELSEPCAPGTTPRWRNGCMATPAMATPFFADFAAGAPWEYSSDAGATWAPAPASAPHLAGDADGLHRWRQTVTIPQGFHGFWYVKVRGGPANIHGTLTYDGVPMADGFKDGTPYVNPANSEQVNGPGWSSGYVPVAAGTHVIEWREGAHTTAGDTTPVILGALAAVYRNRDDVVQIQCLDKATGAVVSTRYELPDGTPYTPVTGAVFSGTRCAGCTA